MHLPQPVPQSPFAVRDGSTHRGTHTQTDGTDSITLTAYTGGNDLENLFESVNIELVILIGRKCFISQSAGTSAKSGPTAGYFIT